MMTVNKSSANSDSSLAIQPPVISTDEQTIEVLKIEDVSVTVGGLVTTLDGNRVNILCEVSGFPDPQITWERDGVQLQRGGKRYTIESAVQNDSGNYTCKASNIAGEANATSRLNVLGKHTRRLAYRDQGFLYAILGWVTPSKATFRERLQKTVCMNQIV